MPAMSSSIDRLFEVLLILRGQLAHEGQRLCLYAPGMPFRKAVPALLRWQDVVSAVVRVYSSRDHSGVRLSCFHTGVYRCCVEHPS
jgi:hypothetical protein